LAQQAQQKPVEKASSGILPLNMGGHLTNTGTGFLDRSSYLEKRGSQSPQRIKGLTLQTLDVKSAKLFHILALEIECCYATLVGFYLPTFRDRLSVPSSRIKHSKLLRLTNSTLTLSNTTFIIQQNFYINFNGIFCDLISDHQDNLIEYKNVKYYNYKISSVN
jgi:hypothetical protein